MNPQLEKIWQGEKYDTNNRIMLKTIRLDWSNDRHHKIVIDGAGTVDDVKEALLRLAHLIAHDPHLRDYRP